LKSQVLNNNSMDEKGGELILSGSDFIKLLCRMLEKGKSFRFQANGFSMHPLIENGDMITVSPLSGTLPRIGDVVAFIISSAGKDKLIVHRVIARKGRCYLMKGDNMLRVDGLVHKSRILGYLTKVEREGKEVPFGLGLERYLIAIISRQGRLYPFLSPVWRLTRPILRRWIN